MQMTMAAHRHDGDDVDADGGVEGCDGGYDSDGLSLASSERTKNKLARKVQQRSPPVTARGSRFIGKFIGGRRDRGGSRSPPEASSWTVPLASGRSAFSARGRFIDGASSRQRPPRLPRLRRNIPRLRRNILIMDLELHFDSDASREPPIRWRVVVLHLLEHVASPMRGCFNRAPRH